MRRGPERGGAWRCSGSPPPCVHPRISGRARVHVHDGVGPPDPCADACPVHLVVSRRAEIGERVPDQQRPPGQRSPRRNPLAAIAIASKEKATQ
jgi:hypothetical protein